MVRTKKAMFCSGFVVAALFLLFSGMLCAQDGALDGNHNSKPVVDQSSSAKHGSNGQNWVPWSAETQKARASQPFMMPPLVMFNVMLAQVVRFDACRQTSSTGDTTYNYGCGRGLEVIPTPRFEFGFYPPDYMTHSANVPNGFNDFNYSVKFRASSRPVGEGGYFVGFFLAGSAPTGGIPNGSGHPTLTPTFAVAKVLGPFDVQSTIGGYLPTSGTNALGRSLPFNTAFDYHLKARLWVMVEQNSTFWVDGPLSGDKQVFLTPAVVWQFKIAHRQTTQVGYGQQIAATRFHQYNHRSVFTIRFPF